jgi:hypothetical protein
MEHATIPATQPYPTPLAAAAPAAPAGAATAGGLLFIVTKMTPQASTGMLAHCSEAEG